MFSLENQTPLFPLLFQLDVLVVHKYLYDSLKLILKDISHLSSLFFNHPYGNLFFLTCKE